MTERRSSYLGSTPGPGLVVIDALCHGNAQGRECGADLSNLVVAACQGEAKSRVTLLCPLCLNQVTFKLEWRLVPVCQRPKCSAG